MPSDCAASLPARQPTLVESICPVRRLARRAARDAKAALCQVGNDAHVCLRAFVWVHILVDVATDTGRSAEVVAQRRRDILGSDLVRLFQQATKSTRPVETVRELSLHSTAEFAVAEVV